MILPRVTPAVILYSTSIACHSSIGEAFCSAPGIISNPFGLTRHCRTTPVLLGSAPNNDDDSDIDNSDGGSQSNPTSESSTPMNLDQQKLSLENLIEESDISNKNTAVLTTSRKKRLEREIELLKRLDLNHPDNNSNYSNIQNQELVISELWSLWYGERGPKNEEKLHKIEGLLNDPSQWPDAEKKYLALIKEHCCGADGSMDNIDLSNWVEPANRLATLYFLEGRLEESRQWCERILDAKPWHVGALSGIVMVCAKLNKEEDAIKYARLGLPNIASGDREEWVKRNVHLAEANLKRLEESTKKAYGEPDESNNGMYVGYEVIEDNAGESDDDDDWQ
jgi:tetratricopeptide (TPR) repeat protein